MFQKTAAGIPETVPPLQTPEAPEFQSRGRGARHGGRTPSLSTANRRPDRVRDTSTVNPQKTVQKLKQKEEM